MDEKSSGNRQGWGKKRWNSPQTHGRITYPHLWKKENIIDSKMLSLSRPGFLWSFPPRRERKIKQDLKAPNMKTRIQVCSYRFFLCFNPGQGRTAWAGLGPGSPWRTWLNELVPRYSFYQETCSKENICRSKSFAPGSPKTMEILSTKGAFGSVAREWLYRSRCSWSSYKIQDLTIIWLHNLQWYNVFIILSLYHL